MPELRGLTGLDYLRTVVLLLRRARIANHVAGVWEAADYEWWWRRQRPTDQCQQLFWFEDGAPVVAATVTDWGGRLGLDFISMPGSSPEFLAEVFHIGLANATEITDGSIEVMVDDNDSAIKPLLVESGFQRSSESGASAWMPTNSRPKVTALAGGYRLATREELRPAPHHLSVRNGPDVERRLQQTSMYRPELDLAVVDRENQVVGFGLFWHDPVTGVGFVEPVGVDERHRRRGIARHILTAGLEMLALAGSTRLKINFEYDNEVAATLYPDLGFETAMETSIFVRS